MREKKRPGTPRYYVFLRRGRKVTQGSLRLTTDDPSNVIRPEETLVPRKGVISPLVSGRTLTAMSLVLSSMAMALGVSPVTGFRPVYVSSRRASVTPPTKFVYETHTDVISVSTELPATFVSPFREPSEFCSSRSNIVSVYILHTTYFVDKVNR